VPDAERVRSGHCGGPGFVIPDVDRRRGTVTHIAGPALTYEGRLIRQRCSWCGAVLINMDLTMVATPDPNWQPSVWAFESLVHHDGPVWSVVDPESTEPGTWRAPDDCCMRLPPAVTLTCVAEEDETI
jgi:hypothetical protein